MEYLPAKNEALLCVKYFSTNNFVCEIILLNFAQRREYVKQASLQFVQEEWTGFL